MSPENRRRALKYALAVIAALAVVHFAEIWNSARITVQVTYPDAPPGRLEVTYTDADGDRLRRTRFAADAPRQHEISLPGGRVDAELRVGDETRRRRLTLREPGVLAVQWRQ